MNWECLAARFATIAEICILSVIEARLYSLWPPGRRWKLAAILPSVYGTNSRRKPAVFARRMSMNQHVQTPCRFGFV